MASTAVQVLRRTRRAGGRPERHILAPSQHLMLIHMRKLRTDEEAQNLFITARELAETIDLEPKFETV